MKKSFITEMPDKSGAFLKAGKIIAHYGGNIVRVSYNKSLDVHTLFFGRIGRRDAACKNRG